MCGCVCTGGVCGVCALVGVGGGLDVVGFHLSLSQRSIVLH